MKITIPLTRPRWDRLLETEPLTAERLTREVGPDPIEYSSNHPSFLLLNLTITSQVDRIVPRMVENDEFDLQVLTTPKGTVVKSFWGPAEIPTLWLSAETLAALLGHDSVAELLFKDF
jgi:hypothetical protein